MGESFNKLKRRVVAEVLVKSAVIGLSCGLTVAGILILALRSSYYHWAFNILIGFAVALVAGGLCCMLTYPTDMQVARRYDAEFGLNEKLQTMVTFRQEQGEMYVLQRQDALQRLNDAPAVKIKFSRIWYFIVMAVIALTIFLSGCIVLASAQSGDGTGKPLGPTTVIPINPGDGSAEFVYDLAMQADMAELIGNVRDSGVESGVKQYMVEQLEALDAKLKSATSKNNVVLEVFAAVSDIDDKIVKSNSFKKLGDELEHIDENLSSAISKGFAVYKGNLVSGMNINYVNALCLGLGDEIDKNEAVAKYFADSLAEFKVSQLPTEGIKLLDFIENYNAGLESSLLISGVDSNDELYASLDALLKSLITIRRQVLNGGTTDSVLWGRIDDSYEIMRKNAVTALGVQGYKCVMEAYIRQELSDILKIQFNELIDLYEDLQYETGDGSGNGDGSGDGDGNGSGSGGSGEGNIVVGGDDLIYYPKTGKMEKLSTVLADYEKALINGTLEEDFPEYLKDFFEKYLNYLRTGTGEETSR